ncbi:MAG: prepilin-type N-terminal cleavage/methylation domain-containing protein [Actinobacteria bacterium]|nr:prepilin-type N-terminal cleavage/methylation domain-containing protein [Actinomycetota bacterium]MCL6105123.1 prepilin-type N-terminal cleavage/methylation domain-containing protein [Actinomycetota bacterium]
MKLLSLKRKHCTGCMGAEVEEGFTLIELMVVLLIMAILIAIAIPTFLGVRGSAQNRAAQSDLTNGLTTAKLVYEISQSYNPGTNYSGTGAVDGTAQSCAGLLNPTALACVMGAKEPTLSYYPGSAISGPNELSVTTGTTAAQSVELAAYSASGACWYILDVESNASTVNSGATGTFYGAAAKQTSCTAAIGTAPASGWKNSFTAAGTAVGI